MYVSFEEKYVKVFKDNGSLLRRTSLPSEVQQAYVSGDKVVVLCADGSTYLYNANGALIRRSK